MPDLCKIYRVYLSLRNCFLGYFGGILFCFPPPPLKLGESVCGQMIAVFNLFVFITVTVVIVIDDEFSSSTFLMLQMQTMFYDK